MTSEQVKIFIGSGEQSLLERKVLIYSLRKHTQRNLDIRVFNGTHNAIESEGSETYPAPLSLSLKYRNFTEFSLYRYLIPEVCSFRGRAIYLDSDMVCLTDIAELFDTALNDYDFLAKRNHSDRSGERMWGLSAMLIDCQRCRFPLAQFFEEIDAGLYNYGEFSHMGQRFLVHHPYRPGELDPQWNVYDRCDSQTKVIHYTELFTQPWKYPGHPYGEIWFSYLREAQAAGFVTDRDIDLTIRRGFARLDLHEGNNPGLAAKFKRKLKKALSRDQRRGS